MTLHVFISSTGKDLADYRQAAIGISLQLDWLDPGAARGFDADSGVNHTYAFFELATIQSSGLGRGRELHVGDNTWFAGLMFEF